MPRNIELKVRLASLDTARKTAQRIATSRLGLLHQVDTYFHVPRGRLKLREFDGVQAELIAYHRDDAAHARESEYSIVPISDPALLKQALAAVLGIRAVVDKTREVFLHHNARIHLDHVQGLGTFLEFEAVLSEEINETAGRGQVEWLCRQFGIEPGDVLAESYGDLLAR
jgi:predicted adenylyl cyclase CyaB